MASPKDRRDRLIQSTTFNGIDFVELDRTDRQKLLIHFINRVPVRGSIEDIKIAGGETISEVKILNSATINDPGYWSTEIITGHQILTIIVASPGDFSRYILKLNLKLNSTSLDPFSVRLHSRLKPSVRRI